MDEAAKKHALRAIPYALYLVGVRERVVTSPQEHLHAFVGSWVTQTSFKPPMIVVCVKAESRANALVRETRVLTLNLLGADQKTTAQRFFKDLVIDADEMSGVKYAVEPRTGCPVFAGAIGWVACEVVAALDPDGERPDHTPFLCRVVEAGWTGPDAPLTKAETGWVYGG